MPQQTILIADDDPTVVALLSTALRKDGYRVITAQDAMQAGLVARKDNPAAVVLDIQMPGGTGLNVLKQIKQSRLTSQIPVVAISSLDDPQLPEKIRGLGAESFMPKPVDPAALSAELKRLLE